MSIIFLDIETIGLPNKINGQYSSYKNLNAYDTARIVQIAIIESNKSGKIISKHDWIINPNINIDNSHIHGITNEIAKNKGIAFTEIVEKIKSLFTRAILIVAHNINFDKSVLLSELYRNKAINTINIINDIPIFCTCISTVNIVKLPTNKYGYKYPKLEELYYYLFQKKPVGLHNAMIDITLTFECFYELIRLEYFELD